jgi:two-component system alkaline phosphatase synthesis response regulator PhoP
VGQFDLLAPDAALFLLFLPLCGCFMRKKILVVEDNADMLELLRLSVKAAGFSVVTACHGIDGLERARSGAPDLIVLDLMLPELDGIAVCETLRKDPATANIPVIMLTGMSGELSRLAGLDCGANDYLTKPISTDDLISRIKTLLAGAPAPVNATSSPR